MLSLAKTLVMLGLALVVTGGLVYAVARLGLPLGRLPGDIRIQSGNFTCLFPVVTMIVLSVVLTVLLNILLRFLNK